jgi:hypothetical protein
MCKHFATLETQQKNVPFEWIIVVLGGAIKFTIVET